MTDRRKFGRDAGPEQIECGTLSPCLEHPSLQHAAGSPDCLQQDRAQQRGAGDLDKSKHLAQPLTPWRQS
ncbi:MAG: hypothetical protein ACRD9W_12200 [Terriglobia bacterium]